MSRLAKNVYHVLVADDSEDDRVLLKAAMHRVSRLQIAAEVTNGDQLIDYFNGLEEFSDRTKYPIPDLLLLDLKMPRKNGFEVLEWLQSQPFHQMIVVVLTDSMHPEHIKRALELGADLFQVKPHARYDREAMIMALEEHLTAYSAPLRSRSQLRLARATA